MYELVVWSFERLAVAIGIVLSVYVLVRVVSMAYFRAKSEFKKEDNSGSKG